MPRYFFHLRCAREKRAQFRIHRSDAISPAKQLTRCSLCAGWISASGRRSEISRTSLVLTASTNCWRSRIGHHERTQAANHAVAVVEVEVLDVPIPTSFEHDRKTVDDDPPSRASFLAFVTGRPWLFAPSPLMSMTRRAASTPLPSRSRTL